MFAGPCLVVFAVTGKPWALRDGPREGVPAFAHHTCAPAYAAFSAKAGVASYASQVSVAKIPRFLPPAVLASLRFATLALRTPVLRIDFFELRVLGF